MNKSCEGSQRVLRKILKANVIIHAGIKNDREAHEHRYKINTGPIKGDVKQCQPFGHSPSAFFFLNKKKNNNLRTRKLSSKRRVHHNKDEL